MAKTQHNFWIHSSAAAVVVGAGLFLRVSSIEWCLLMLAIVAVMSAEALNTAFELLCDVASPDFHPIVEKSKDVAAGAVLLTAVGSVVIGLLIFSPKLFSAVGY